MAATQLEVKICVVTAPSDVLRARKLLRRKQAGGSRYNVAEAIANGEAAKTSFRLRVVNCFVKFLRNKEERVRHQVSIEFF